MGGEGRAAQRQLHHPVTGHLVAEPSGVTASWALGRRFASDRLGPAQISPRRANSVMWSAARKARAWMVIVG